MNRLRHLPGVRWVLAVGGLIRVLRRSTRAFLDADRALRRLTIAFERLDAALARRTPEDPFLHKVPLHPMDRCERVPLYPPTPAPYSTPPAGRYKMDGGTDSVEPLNLEGWMQLHAKTIGWNGRIVADPSDRA